MMVTLYGRDNSRFMASDTRKGVIFGCYLHFGMDTSFEINFNNNTLNINDGAIVGTVEEKE